MKKIILTFIFSMIMLTGTISTVSATEKVSSELSNEETVSLINQFIKTEGIPNAYAAIRENGETSDIILSLDGDTLKNTFMNLINDFMHENNIDTTKIFSISNAMYYKYWFRDINDDDKINVRDCAFIASKLAKGEELSDRADYNLDGKADVRDAAALASSIVQNVMQGTQL